jgi:hypothetical protein
MRELYLLLLLFEGTLIGLSKEKAGNKLGF